MKKILSILAVALVPLFAQTVWTGKIDTVWHNASQTEFTITTAEQLAGLAKLVNGGNNFKGKSIKLGANIMLNDTINWLNWKKKAPKNTWIPIGTKDSTSIFNGIFDGNGYVVSGVYINTTNNGQGLFRNVLSSGVIKNLGIAASYIKGEGTVGGLIGGANFGVINNSYFIGVVIGTNNSGGLVSGNNGTVSNSYSIGTTRGTDYVGGLVGVNNGVVTNSYSTSDVIGKERPGWIPPEGVGGLVGFNRGTISFSYSTGTRARTSLGVETGEGKEYGSALVGYNDKGTINNSYHIKEGDFAGWDFNETWGIKSSMNCGYPYLLENKGQQACQDSVKNQQKLTELTGLLKANELEECYNNCNQLGSQFELNKKIKDLCEKQLIDKIKKTPKNKITPKIAEVYYNCTDDNCKHIYGDVIVNINGMILLNSFFQEEIDGLTYFYKTIMVQTSGHIIGGLKACMAPSRGTYFFTGRGKYIGKKTYTTILGKQETVPNFQLLWCEFLSN